MKKKQRQMIGMLLALVVLAAAFLGIRQYNKNASSAASTTEGSNYRTALRKMLIAFLGLPGNY